LVFVFHDISLSFIIISLKYRLKFDPLLDRVLFYAFLSQLSTNRPWLGAPRPVWLCARDARLCVCVPRSLSFDFSLFFSRSLGIIISDFSGKSTLKSHFLDLFLGPRGPLYGLDGGGGVGRLLQWMTISSMS